VKLLAEKIYNEEISGVDQVFDEFKSNQKRELLSQLYDKPALSCEKIESIEKYYNFGSTKNSEILFRLSSFSFIYCLFVYFFKAHVINSKDGFVWVLKLDGNL
jgi:hypothetical protein